MCTSALAAAVTWPTWIVVWLLAYLNYRAVRASERSDIDAPLFAKNWFAPWDSAHRIMRSEIADWTPSSDHPDAPDPRITTLKDGRRSIAHSDLYVYTRAEWAHQTHRSVASRSGLFANPVFGILYAGGGFLITRSFILGPDCVRESLSMFILTWTMLMLPGIAYVFRVNPLRWFRFSADGWRSEEPTSGYPIDWDTRRRSVYKRDGFKCVNCGARGGTEGSIELHAHHIVPLSAGGSNELTNLATLCADCHAKLHPHMRT